MAARSAGLFAAQPDAAVSVVGRGFVPVSQYIETKLTDSDLLANVPQLGAPTDSEIQTGRRLFLEKGCASCHAVEGVGPQQDFGPDLSALGAKNVSELYFGKRKDSAQPGCLYPAPKSRTRFR